MLPVGSEAPDFSGVLDDGSTFHLASYRGQKHVVLYFYPKDFTPGCTKEACTFRDNYDAIGTYDAIIVGVSADDAGNHASFRDRHGLQFPLIADPKRGLAARYDVRGLLPFMQPRVTYVIDREGVIRAAIRHDLLVNRHVPEVIEALASLGHPAAPAPHE